MIYVDNLKKPMTIDSKKCQQIIDTQKKTGKTDLMLAY